MSEAGGGGRKAGALPQRWRDVRNQFGDDTRQIAVIQPELTLRFAHQDNSDYLTCPLVRLQRDSQGAWLYRRDVSPAAAADPGQPLAGDAASNSCSSSLACLTRLMAMRRESNERMADFAVADVSLFWLLNALNSVEPVLGVLSALPAKPAGTPLPGAGAPGW
ncbi:type VI secretion system baseplate subunit TssK [Klebsiella pneumoniae]